jgi:T5SS/PEP-CTERM-associated repeat protein/autotransporter-associated beta strand protein
LVVTNGGVVGVGGVLYASLNKLSGNGTINAYGAVLDANLVFDATHGTPQTIAFGSGGTLNLQSTKELGVGYKGIGTLRISGGKAVSCGFGYLGYMADSTGTATVTGTGSLWSGSNTALCIGYSGNGILNVEAGGHVSFFSVSLSGTKSTATISGSGSLLNGTARLTVNQGTLNIESGGQVTCATGTVDSSSIVTLIGTDSSWTIEDELTVGDSVNGILNIGANQSPGGSVQATKLTIAKSSGSGICNINNGGKLLASNILKGNGTATFNWNDGTIKNFGNLAISNNLDLKLAETGTHTFNIDSNRTGTINSILSDASSGGTLDKIGAGTLLLTAVNTYSGGTTVEEGRFKVTGSILNTSGITVGETAILELAKNSGSATAANVPIDNDGKLLISIGSQNTGMITGNGTTQVYAGATLTAASIMQDTLIIGGTAASWASSSESSSANQVPEPSAITLVFAGFLGVLFPIWRRKLG